MFSRLIFHLQGKMKIGTHNGSFHADEVLACALLRVLPRLKDAEIVRTRDPALLETCDIVVDVGAVFDAERQRFDHHQKTFTHTFNSLDSSYKYTTKLSSAGLVYFHFGKEIISTLIQTDAKSSDVDGVLVEKLFVKIYEKFIEEVDAIDNGISTHDTPGRYTINTNFSRRIGAFNPSWNEPGNDIDERFHRAMAVAEAEFTDKVQYFSRSWWPARKIVADALEQRFSAHSSGRALLFLEGGAPWKEHLFELEQEQGLDGNILYTIYTDQSGKWRIQCVPQSPDSFENRLSLPAAWRGVRDDELAKVSGVDGAIFVHASGFIGGAETKEGILKMLEISLEQA